MVWFKYLNFSLWWKLKHSNLILVKCYGNIQAIGVYDLISNYVLKGLISAFDFMSIDVLSIKLAEASFQVVTLENVLRNRKYNRMKSSNK